MTHGCTVALAVAALLASGCAGGSVTPAPPPPQQQIAGAPSLTESSAARFILANVGSAARSPQRAGGDDEGGRGELQLPELQPCGLGTFATDCSAWVFASGHATRATVRSAQSVASASPPALNFCRDSAGFPADLGAPALPIQSLFATFSFGLTYAGTKPAPIVTYVTRSANISVQGTFAGTAVSAPSIALTPVLTTSASRGWLVFFTWSWPADILLVPYEINEIQLAASSSPLAVPAGGSAPLGAFDCLGRPIVARADGSFFSLA